VANIYTERRCVRGLSATPTPTATLTPHGGVVRATTLSAQADCAGPFSLWSPVRFECGTEMPASLTIRQSAVPQAIRWPLIYLREILALPLDLHTRRARKPESPWLLHAHSHALDRELGQDDLRNVAGQRFDQVVV